MAMTEEQRLLERIQELEGVLQDIIGDYDRRKAKWHGRFLLWLLRKTT